MTACIDTSVLVSSMVATEAHHAACARILNAGDAAIYLHSLAETFNTLTGGNRSFRLPAADATLLIEEDYLPHLTVISLTAAETLRAMRESESRGVRGTAIFDFLHLVAARKAGAEKLFTLNIGDFRAFRRAGDPEIVQP